MHRRPSILNTRALGDDFWFCAHNEWGELRLSTRAAGFAATSLLLAELLESHQLEVDSNGHLRRPVNPPAIAHPSHRDVLHAMASEPRRSLISEWLQAWMPEAMDFIADRLRATGEIKTITLPPNLFRLRWTSCAVLAPVDELAAYAVGDRLSSALESGRLRPGDVVLSAILQIVNLHRTLISGVPHVDHRIEVHHARLRPTLQVLLAHTKQAVDQAALSQRLRD